ncbi:MAG: amidohydrolase [Gemmatimonadota bacterium]|nr:amidohydrolase [Gemmatimonadota bacterium]
MPPISSDMLTPMRDALVAFRHDIHRHPELGFQETRTAGKVAEALRAAGLEVHEGIGGTGIVGVLRRGNGPRSILLRADMDALPIQENSVHDHVSETPGVMHACGHDGHTTMLLGAAQCLAESDSFGGTVYFLFQPNEEHGLGAKAMLADGVLDQFPADEVYAIHNLPGEPLGVFSTCSGTICSSETLFEINIRGRGGHAAMPQVGVDAILVGAEVVQALQSIVARKVVPGSGIVVSVTEFITDGARNVLPGNAQLKGDFRARTPADRELVSGLIRQICAGVAQIHRVDIAVDIRTTFVETINAAEQTRAAMQAATNSGFETRPDRHPMSFSEDFAHFAAACPGCFILMGNGTEGSHGQPLHASDYDFNDQALTLGAAFWACLVHERLSGEDTAHV